MGQAKKRGTREERKARAITKLEALKAAQDEINKRCAEVSKRLGIEVAPIDARSGGRFAVVRIDELEKMAEIADEIVSGSGAEAEAENG